MNVRKEEHGPDGAIGYLNSLEDRRGMLLAHRSSFRRAGVLLTTRDGKEIGAIGCKI